MLRSLRALCAVSTFTIAVLGPGALLASGDDGPPPSTRTDRPARTVLRPREVPELAPLRLPVPSSKEAIILVSGINSFPQDPTFDALIAKLFDDPRYVIYRFGADPTFPYDALGDLDVSARSLRDEIRTIGATHPAVHVIAHSMGGAVADRAFAAGLSAQDGVATYIALAAPHSGSGTLAASGKVLALAGDQSLEVRAAFSPKLDPGSDAAKGLAHTRPLPPPAGVTRLDLRMSTDWTVTARDAKDPGVDSRVLIPSGLRDIADGHGGVTRDPEALRLITSTIAARAVPPDMRGIEVRSAADAQSDLASVAAAALQLLALAAAAGICLTLMCAPYLRLITRRLAIDQLRAVRRK